ncbi:MAG: sigma-70 family RNA polymerase sigma factor [Parvibaculaceae bacterium]
MTSGPRKRVPPLTLVKGASGSGDAGRDTGADASSERELNWSILMAHAQAGDAGAYRRLLGEISPYLRRLVARRHSNPADIEDTVQDILLTIHAIRYTYDPTRPFGPWLVTIAQRRIIDRLRRRGRLHSREELLTAEHETLPTEEANIVDEMSDRRELHEAVERLPASQREAIRLLKLKEMTLKEAAEATGMSITALKVATHRALNSLRKMLSRGSEEQ